MYEKVLLQDGEERKQKPGDVLAQSAKAKADLDYMRFKVRNDERQEFFVSGNNWSLLSFGVVGGYK